VRFRRDAGVTFPKPYADIVARLRVPAGFLLVAAFAWISKPTGASLLAGFPLCTAGLALRAWAAGHLAKNERLATSGPYRRMRNPLYAGTLLVAAGLAVASRSWVLGILFTAVFLLVYLPVVTLEEQHLRELFPQYAEYAGRVPAFWPGRPAGSAEQFQLRLYLKNEEYKALAGFLAGACLLLWKALG
jgi:protein-S-isoprenylcysteine O-methyltransferase Ste14